MKRCFVICLTDEGAYVFATRRYFQTWDAAMRYCESIAASRKPIIIEEDRPLVLCTVTGFEQHGEYPQKVSRQAMENRMPVNRTIKFFRHALGWRWEGRGRK